MSDDRGTQSAKRKKLYGYATTYHLEREERLTFSEMILRRDVPSWLTLSDYEVDRLLDAFEGHALLAHHLAEAVSPAATPG